ncbi:HAMP domain-containing histidine kinase [Dysgonomonas sp. OttesenSCG-928-D17]|nr:HAMP domain-containing histidine kinase [Dysgonomonas sp. OttesenSCG-928-D17]
MRFRFRLIAFIILALLVLVCGYQVYWLLNFHNEQYHKMELAIMNSMSNADFKEIALRITDVHKLLELDSIPPQNQNGVMTNPSYKMPDVVVRIESKKNGVNIWSNAEQMNISVQQGFHRTIDSLKEVNVVRFDSILHAELSLLDINIPYYLEYVDIVNDSVLMRLPDSISTTERLKYEEYIFPFTENNTQAYHLYLKRPKWHIFKSMTGLVCVSALMIILLIISYIYLLKIILRQKTIDEIKSDFINNMTHELKTPISVTYAAVDAMQNFGMGDEPEKRNRYLTVSKEQLTYLNSLVEQILTMSVEERKNLKITPEKIYISAIFEKQKSQFLLNSAKPVTFTIDIESEGLAIEGDRLHFGNVISNLIENAIKYSGESVDIKLSAYRKGDTTIISVCDNGIGIPQNLQDKIFDKFYRVSKGNIHDVKGYGLGLYYVKTIIDKHNWKIEIESTEGQGSCFNIIII